MTIENNDPEGVNFDAQVYEQLGQITDRAESVLLSGAITDPILTELVENQATMALVLRDLWSERFQRLFDDT